VRELTLFDLKKVDYHKDSEKLAQHLTAHCENDNPMFFRVIVSYFLGKVAAEMRAEIRTHNNTYLPVNVYAINLAPSGAGKTKAMNFLEEQVCHLFYDRFKGEVLPYAAEKHMAKLAIDRSMQTGESDDYELKKIHHEFKDLGQWLTSFDSATPAALKQFRHKLLLANCGSLNLEIDEIGDNLTGNTDALSKLLELYDKGKLKESLVKNTKENTRMSEVKGQTPCNLIMFGTPSSLLDGSKTEEEFIKMLEKGYARRCFFGFVPEVNCNLDLTAEDIYERNMSKSANQFVTDFAQTLLKLADPINYGKKLKLEKDEDILLIEYKMYCQDRAAQLSEFSHIQRAELEHRPFKTLKLAATYAFIEGTENITSDNIYNAIALAEESGEGIQFLLNREPPYTKLARFLGQSKVPVTQVELSERLPFYKGTKQFKEEMLDYAIAYGYQNNIIIKKQYNESVLFLKGESLEETSLEQLIVRITTLMNVCLGIN
jgi:hypothetical protein